MSSEAATSTSPSATMVTLSPVAAYVCTVSTATETLPATPTVPPPAPTTTDTIVSLAVADTTTSSAALTCAEAPMNASVLRLTTRTPTGTATPADPPMAIVPAMPSS